MCARRDGQRYDSREIDDKPSEKGHIGAMTRKGDDEGKGSTENLLTGCFNLFLNSVLCLACRH
jgi:hypothetical protein